MAQFTKTFVQDLHDDIRIRQCGSLAFNADALSNVITVELYEGDSPATLSGTVVGSVICPDGSTVTINNGSISGNKVSITLTGDCFAIPGQIGVGIQIVSGSTKTTVLKAIYTVELFETSTVVDPESRITASVGDLIDDINAAVASIPADLTDLLGAIAPTFSSSTSYTVGKYVWYNQHLYRFKNDHSGNWSSSDVTQVAVMTEMPKYVSWSYDQTLTTSQKAKARTNIAAAALPALDLGNNDIVALTQNTDLNTVTSPGTYRCSSAADAATMTNAPVTNENYRFIVSMCVTSTSLFQCIIARSTQRVFLRTGTNGGSGIVWNDWMQFASTANIAALSAVSYASQSLTDAEKTQARTNIGAVSVADVTSAIASAITVSGTALVVS